MEGTDKYKIAYEVYQKLVQARGDSRYPPPPISDVQCHEGRRLNEL